MGSANEPSQNVMLSSSYNKQLSTKAAEMENLTSLVNDLECCTNAETSIQLA